MGTKNSPTNTSFAERYAKRLAWILLALGLLPTLYLSAYACVRATHRLVHCAWFISEEGLNAHTEHQITPGCYSSHPVNLWPVIFAPAIDLELAFHRRRRP